MSAETALALRALPIIARDEMDAAMALFEDRDLAALDVQAGELMDIMASYPEAPPTTAGENAALVALAARADKVMKQVEALKKRRLEPLLTEAAAVRAFLAGMLAPLGEKFDRQDGEAERWLRAYRTAEQARIAREQEAARLAAEAAARAEGEALATGDMAAAEAASQAQMMAEAAAPRPVPRAVKTEDGTRTYITKWLFEIVDPAQVPRQFCEPDKVAIALAVKSGVRTIPGVNIYEGEQPRRTR